jgi:thiamine-phosphate diphosphorylase
VKVPLLHVIATDEVAEAPTFRSMAGELMEAGGGRLALHLRLVQTNGRSFHGLAEGLGAMAAGAGAWCVVNGRVDVALAAGVQAVQLGRGALPVREVRKISRGRLAIGASVHSAEEGADFLVAGSVFSTETHPDRVPAGPALVTACAVAGVPVVGIGGIDASNAGQVITAGAAGVAVVRAVWQAADPVEQALRLIERVSDRAGA